jgi:hypothetical protein
MDSRPVLSPTAISGILTCPKRWFLEHELGVEEIPEAVYVGWRFHAAVGAYFQLKLEGVAAGLDSALQGLRASWGETDGRRVRWETSPAESLTLTENLVRAYLQWAEAPSRMRPAAVEESLTLELPHCVLKGVLDCPQVDGRIVEWKTAATRQHAVRESQRLIQPLVYALLKAGGDIDRASRIPFEYHFVTKAQPPLGVFPILVYPRRTDLELLLWDLIPKVARLVEHGLWFPNPAHESCGPRLCPAWGACRSSQADYSRFRVQR